MASQSFPVITRCAFGGLGKVSCDKTAKSVRRGSSQGGSRTAPRVNASSSHPTTLGGMRRMDDGTWDGALPPRCRVSKVAGKSPDTKPRRNSTVSEASRKLEAAVSLMSTEAYHCEDIATEETHEAPDFSWTPTGFIPDHENNIIAHLFGGGAACQAEASAEGNQSSQVLFGSDGDEKSDDDDAAEAAALIAVFESDKPNQEIVTAETTMQQTDVTKEIAPKRSLALSRYKDGTQHGPSTSSEDCEDSEKKEEMEKVVPKMSAEEVVSKPKKKKLSGVPIIFVTSEVAPYSKTGGLGDVCGALPKALAAKGNAVVVVSPLYEEFAGVAPTDFSCQVSLGHETHTIRYWRQHKHGVTYLFVQHISLQRGGGGKIYGDAEGPYSDNAFRFALLSLSAIEAPLCVPWGELFFGGGVVGAATKKNFTFTSAPVFVANDWHAALTPVFLTARYQSVARSALQNRLDWAPEGSCEAIARATCVTIVHNLFHLGIFPADLYRSLHLPELHGKEWFPSLRWRWGPGRGESMNFLKAGLALSSAAVLVSPTYAKETQTKLLGCGMDGVLRSVGNFGSDADFGVMNGVMSGNLIGVVNGVDLQEWNPGTDTHLAQCYSADLAPGETFTNASTGKTVFDVMAGKAANKASLQRELGLREDPFVPLIGFIGRLDSQKGVDVLLDVVPRLVELGAQVVLLGSGDPGLENGLRQIEMNFPGNAVGWVGFSVPVSHRITSAIDILAMPSRFEPCGLNQLYALRYGTLPVAHKTGGLKDTVTPDVGFPFAPCNRDALCVAMEHAVWTYRNDQPKWQKMRLRAMRKDLGWDVAADKYERLLKRVAAPAPHALNHESLRESNPALAQIRASEDTSSEWKDAEKRAEKTRIRASNAPDRDTREAETTTSEGEDSWARKVQETLKNLLRI